MLVAYVFAPQASWEKIKPPKRAADARRDMADGMAAPEERIADAFNRYFDNFNIRVEAGEVRVGSRREIRARGWRIRFRVVPDDAGSPSLEFYATHRMTNDRHVRIWADGYLEHLDAIHGFFGYDPKVSGSEETAKQEHLKHNRMVAEQLRAAGLYPDGDINAYLRTGADRTDNGIGSADAREGGQ